MSHPSDVTWPWDLKDALPRYRSTKIEKMETERALLGFLLAKIHKIDPDIVVGHDIYGFDLNVLLHRVNANKIPHWSRLGRLRRTQMPKLTVGIWLICCNSSDTFYLLFWWEMIIIRDLEIFFLYCYLNEKCFCANSRFSFVEFLLTVLMLLFIG